MAPGRSQLVGLELFPGFYPGSNKQHRLFSKASTENVLVRAVLLHPAHCINPRIHSLAGDLPFLLYSWDRDEPSTIDRFSRSTL